MRIICAGLASRSLRRNRRENRRHAAVGELHVVIPLVANVEGLHTPRDFVIRQVREVRVPMRVHRPVREIIAALPAQKLRAAQHLRDLDRKMNRAEARAFAQYCVERRAPAFIQQWMTRTAAGKQHDGVRALEHTGVFRPIVAHHGDIHSRHSREAFLKQQKSRAVLMLEIAVARIAREEDNFLFRRAAVQSSEQPDK